MDSNSLTRGLPTHLTLFYSKRTGAVKKYTTGITDLFKAFGQDEGEELSLIYGTIIIDYDDDIVNEYSKYSVIDGVVKKNNDQLGEVVESVKEVKELGVESLSYIFDLDFRVLEIECALEPLTLADIRNGKLLSGINTYKTAKTLILTGNFVTDEMEYKLSVFLKNGRLTQDEYDELISLMLKKRGEV